MEDEEARIAQAAGGSITYDEGHGSIEIETRNDLIALECRKREFDFGTLDVACIPGLKHIERAGRERAQRSIAMN